MTNIPTGGPAFPCIVPGRPMRQTESGAWVMGTEPSHDPGMTLRDWFAGQAMKTLAYYWEGNENSTVAKEAYAIADAMIAERNKP